STRQKSDILDILLFSVSKMVVKRTHNRVAILLCQIQHGQIAAFLYVAVGRPDPTFVFRRALKVRDMYNVSGLYILPLAIVHDLNNDFALTVLPLLGEILYL